jgi:hypothetical protein
LAANREVPRQAVILSLRADNLKTHQSVNGSPQSVISASWRLNDSPHGANGRFTDGFVEGKRWVLGELLRPVAARWDLFFNSFHGRRRLPLGEADVFDGLLLRKNEWSFVVVVIVIGGIHDDHVRRSARMIGRAASAAHREKRRKNDPSVVHAR